MAENTALTRQVKQNTDLLEDIHRHVVALSDESRARDDDSQGAT